MNSESQNAKLVVIMGSTGVGKSKLSIELATRFYPTEIINCDKMQVYRGLDVTTNKISKHEQLGISHHLFDQLNPSSGELSAAQFRSHATSTVAQILTKSHLPIIVGGSNSFIHALVSTDHHNSGEDPTNSDWIFTVSGDLRFSCCFIWVDVAFPVLSEYLGVRLDSMFRAGMFEEIGDFYDHYESYKSAPVGLRKSIGVPEFEEYFRRFPLVRSGGDMVNGTRVEEEKERKALYEEAKEATKENTCQLAKAQVEKIKMLKTIGWNIQRLDATEVFKAALASDHERAAKIWNKGVLEPAMKLVEGFLQN